jgi:hypothetical protein
MRLRYVCTALILGGCTLSGSAQTGSISAKVAAGTQMSPVQAQEELLNLFEHEFMGVAQAMPADKYGFAPTAATFTASQSAKYDGVRTFAQEISHVATANYYFASKILGEKMPVDPKSIRGSDDEGGTPEGRCGFFRLCTQGARDDYSRECLHYY